MIDLESWDWHTVGQLCTQVTSGGTPRRGEPSYYFPATVPWIKTGDLADGFVSSSKEQISEAGVANSSAKMLPAATVLMAMYGATVGRLGILAIPAAVNQASCALVVNPHMAHYRWLFYALLNDRARVVSLANGAAQQNVSGQTIRSLHYFVPPLPQQRAIAEVLGALDDKVAANTKLAQTAIDLATARYAEAVAVNPVTVTLNKIADHIPGKYLSKDGYQHGGVFPVFGSNSLMGWHDTASHPGPVAVLARIGSSCGNIRWSESSAWVNNNASGLRAVSGFNPWLLRFSLADVDMNPHVAGSGQPFIRIDSLMAAKIVVPSDVNSLAIISFLEAASKIEASNDDENRALAAMRDTLLPQLMSGKLRVRDAEQLIKEVV